ncbi:MAG: hypothetical protein LBE48_03215 [Methanomassiliicoccaceae archaeon]|jgi:hypothetical protein|nr:hypothetical protein [Methanomassiliicoccaceae archaeon]
MSVRIDSFLSDPNAGTLTGERRMGPEKLLDMLADRLADDDSVNIIRIMDHRNVHNFISSGIRAGKTDHILIYVDLSTEATNDILASFPDAHVYKAKELCHQVPVCFRETVTRWSPACR